ncbi:MULTISPECIES: cation diffusion facilitator family transporter [unclassified Lysinibacillus]|uniref:cation diffusion facilitator family transporter n=1 Tax=unclassified Lysinibacillus TaxID=2636778 RepID=UPI0011703C9B|nr:cation diffusion facilitator family transporter [Lysinibacillus sp. CD3-6]QPQ36150.1 cation transporter [Lysinibacillus sp. JNUCC-52]UED82191.1 cation diffusion facilitator family transporter [Lysinibacillus sp. CD3-6]
MSQSTNSDASIVAGWISLISNIVLTILKIVVGTLFHSPVLLADGYHNAGDVIASGAALTSMRISKRPADEDHPYGHGKAEVISSAIVGIILIIAALYIAYESITAFFHEPEKASLIAFFTAIISLVWKLILYVYTIKIGKKTNSKGLIATAYDHLADVYASIAAVLGIGLALVGELTTIHILTYGDPIAGIIVTILVFKLAYGMLLEAIDTLMEKSVSRDTLDNFASLILTIPEVKRIDRLRAREHGHYVLVDLRVSVPGGLTIQEGHDIIRKIKKTIMEKHQNVEEVLIHLNPWYEDDK